MQDAKEEVRARLNIEDVIGEYVELKRAGRSFKGLSPFSDERTPSFFVSPEKQIWHDFSANRGGDIFSFVMQAEGMEFRQALEHLARKAGVDLSLYQSAGSQKFAKRKQVAGQIHALAAKFYQANLVRNQRAAEYVVKQRGLTKQTLQDFQIGYAPDTGSALTQFLAKKGFSERDMKDAGVVNRFGGDLFRGRMMVPLMDATGQVIGFTGRIIGEVPNAPKYLNTPQTVLYDKGRHVFGLSQAKEAIRAAGYVVLVEGNLDVISSHQAGVKQTVATAGTAMTEYHLQALKRLTTDIRLCFDGDKAGVAATERAIGIASSLGIDLSVITLPGDAKDPDELIQRGAKFWQKAVEQPQPAVEWVIAQYAVREDLATAKGKRTFTTAALALIGRLSDSVEREHYEDMVARKIGSSRSAIHHKQRQLVQAAEQPRAMKPVAAQGADQPIDPRFTYEDELLALAVADEPVRELLGSVEPEWWHEAYRQAFSKYLLQHKGVVEQMPSELEAYQAALGGILLRVETRYGDWPSDDRYFEAARLIRRIEHDRHVQRRDALTEELREAEGRDDEATAATLRAELRELIKQIAKKW